MKNVEGLHATREASIRQIPDPTGAISEEMDGRRGFPMPFALSLKLRHRLTVPLGNGSNRIRRNGEIPELIEIFSGLIEGLIRGKHTDVFCSVLLKPRWMPKLSSRK